MAVKVYSAQVAGLKAGVIEVETDLSPGLHSFTIVGLPDKAVEESKDRISAAIKNTSFNSPQKKNQKVTVSLAPADLRKEGPVFDLAIALAYLLASKQINFETKDKIFFGELALDGIIRPVKGILALVEYAQKSGFKEVFVPKGNVKEAGLVKSLDSSGEDFKIFGCENLKDVVSHLDSREDFELKEQPKTKIDFEESRGNAFLDFSDIKGQESAKRGLEIAAAGGHNILMVGTAGTGKTMLAKAFPTILPPLSFEEILETTLIHSVAGILTGDFLVQRPFRSPHHTSSYVSLTGGGTYPKPGEITLSHRGVLFLDEFTEFERRVIEALRQPLEDGIINISRAKGSLTFPASFILICAMNPCPCGNLGSKTKPCVCSQGSLMRYQRRISGPILDRIDIWVEVPQVEHEKMSEIGDSESSEEIRKRVVRAREIQKERFSKLKSGNKRILTNSEMGVRELKTLVPLEDNIRDVLNQAAKSLDLSGRAYHRVIKLARTIADLEGEEKIQQRHLFEALQYRPK